VELVAFHHFLCSRALGSSTALTQSGKELKTKLALTQAQAVELAFEIIKVLVPTLKK